MYRNDSKTTKTILQESGEFPFSVCVYANVKVLNIGTKIHKYLAFRRSYWVQNLIYLWFSVNIQYIAPSMHNLYVGKIDVPTCFCRLDNLHSTIILNMDELQENIWEWILMIWLFIHQQDKFTSKMTTFCQPTAPFFFFVMLNFTMLAFNPLYSHCDTCLRANVSVQWRCIG